MHTCPGGDKDSTHSAEVPYTSLLPSLLQMRAGYFTMTYASEQASEKKLVLQCVKDNLRPGVRVYLGCTQVTGPAATQPEAPQEIRDLILDAAKVIPISQLGATDDCGFSPFGDDESTPQSLALAKIRARLEGVAMAEQTLCSGASPHGKQGNWDA